MECYEIGAVVRSARIRHGMTQEDLAFGICAVSTLSKIERGVCNPKIGTFEALMERMGEVTGRCILFVGAQELQKQQIEEEIARAVRLRDRMNLVRQLELYRNLPGERNRQEQQWISLGEMVLRWWDMEEHDVIAEGLKTILQMCETDFSNGAFNLDQREKINSCTACEVLILQLLIACKKNSGVRDSCIFRLHDLVAYLETDVLDLKWKKQACISVYYQLAELSLLMEEYPASVRYCSAGLLLCMQMEEFSFAPMLLSLLASGMTKRGDTNRAGKAKEYACAMDKMLAGKNDLLRFIKDILQ